MAGFTRTDVVLKHPAFKTAVRMCSVVPVMVLIDVEEVLIIVVGKNYPEITVRVRFHVHRDNNVFRAGPPGYARVLYPLIFVIQNKPIDYRAEIAPDRELELSSPPIRPRTSGREQQEGEGQKHRAASEQRVSVTQTSPWSYFQHSSSLHLPKMAYFIYRTLSYNPLRNIVSFRRIFG